MKSHLSTKSLNKIKSALPKNGMERIAKELGVNISSVSRVLTGKTRRRTTEVVEIALKIIREKENKLNELETQISNIKNG